MITKRDIPETTEEKTAEEELITIEQSYDTDLILAFQRTVNKIQKQIGVSWLLPSLVSLQTMAVQLYKLKVIDDATYDAICDVIQPVIEGSIHLQI